MTATQPLCLVVAHINTPAYPPSTHTLNHPHPHTSTSTPPGHRLLRGHQRASAAVPADGQHDHVLRRQHRHGRREQHLDRISTGKARCSVAAEQQGMATHRFTVLSCAVPCVCAGYVLCLRQCAQQTGPNFLSAELIVYSFLSPSATPSPPPPPPTRRAAVLGPRDVRLRARRLHLLPRPPAAGPQRQGGRAAARELRVRTHRQQGTRSGPVCRE